MKHHRRTGLELADSFGKGGERYMNGSAQVPATPLIGVADIYDLDRALSGELLESDGVELWNLFQAVAV